MSYLFIGRNGPLPPEYQAVLWQLLVETGKRRPLTRMETRLRCMLAPRPWRDLGIDRSTFYRKRRRERLAAAQFAQAA